MAEIEFVDHYRQDNGRIAGWQLEHGALDVRQQGILFIVKQIKPESVLDLGCSDGTLLISMYKANLIQKGYGVDLWDSGIKWGKEYCERNKIPIVLINGPIELYDGPNVDIAILAEILEHVHDPVECLKLAATKAKKIIITVPLLYKGPVNEIPEIQEHIRQYDYEMLEQHCKAAGLKITYKLKVESSHWPNLIVLTESEGK